MQKQEYSVFDMVKYSVKTLRQFERVERIAYRRVIGMGRPVSETYFLDRAVRQNQTDFEHFHVGREIKRAVKENAEKFVGTLRDKLGTLIPFSDIVETLVPSAEVFAQNIIMDYDFPSEYYFYKQTGAALLPLGADSFCVLARTKQDAEQVVEFVKSEFEKLSDVTKDFGLALDEFLTGRKHQEAILRVSGKIQNLQYKEPKNEFEKEIIDFCTQITNSFLPNVEISFVEPTESYECDVFMGFNEVTKRIVEPTDYETVRNQMPQGENLKSQIVLRTLDKAQRLGAKSVVVAKGFPSDTFVDLKKIAESRDVILLSDTDYKNALPKIFCRDLLKAHAEPTIHQRFIRAYG